MLNTCSSEHISENDHEIEIFSTQYVFNLYSYFYVDSLWPELVILSSEDYDQKKTGQKPHKCNSGYVRAPLFFMASSFLP